MLRKIFNPYKIRRKVSRQFKDAKKYSYISSFDSAFQAEKQDSPNPFKILGAKTMFLNLKISIIVGSFLCSFLILAFNPFFQIKHINISGAERIQSARIRETVRSILNYRIFGILPAWSYPFVDVGEIRDISMIKYPLESIIVSKIFPNALVIKIVEKKPALIFTDGQVIAYLDHQGYLVETIRKVNDSDIDRQHIYNFSTSSFPQFQPNTRSLKKEFGDLPIIVDRKTFIQSINQPISAESARAFTAWSEIIKKLFNCDEHYIMLEDNHKSAQISVCMWGRVLFAPDAKQDEQITKLQSIVNSKSFNKKNFSYIDLRYPNRVYWQ